VYAVCPLGFRVATWSTVTSVSSNVLGVFEFHRVQSDLKTSCFVSFHLVQVPFSNALPKKSKTCLFKNKKKGKPEGERAPAPNKPSVTYMNESCRYEMACMYHVRYEMKCPTNGIYSSWLELNRSQLPAIEFQRGKGIFI